MRSKVFIISVVCLLPRLANAGGDTLFPKGTSDISLAGSFAVPSLGDHEWYTSAIVSYGYYFADNWAIAPTIRGSYVDMQGSYAIGGDFILPLRWHFYTHEKWTAFIDGGAGVSYYDHRIPPGGTNFNFILEGGLGATYQVSENAHIIGGASFVHISNAGIQGSDRHPGSNAIAFYLGWMWTF